MPRAVLKVIRRASPDLTPLSPETTPPASHEAALPEPTPPFPMHAMHAAPSNKAESSPNQNTIRAAPLEDEYAEDASGHSEGTVAASESLQDTSTLDGQTVASEGSAGANYIGSLQTRKDFLLLLERRLCARPALSRANAPRIIPSPGLVWVTTACNDRCFSQGNVLAIHRFKNEGGDVLMKEMFFHLSSGCYRVVAYEFPWQAIHGRLMRPSEDVRLSHFRLREELRLLLRKAECEPVFSVHASLKAMIPNAQRAFVEKVVILLQCIGASEICERNFEDWYPCTDFGLCQSLQATEGFRSFSAHEIGAQMKRLFDGLMDLVLESEVVRTERDEVSDQFSAKQNRLLYLAMFHCGFVPPLSLEDVNIRQIALRVSNSPVFADRRLKDTFVEDRIVKLIKYLPVVPPRRRETPQVFIELLDGLSIAKCCSIRTLSLKYCYDFNRFNETSNSYSLFLVVCGRLGDSALTTALNAWATTKDAFDVYCRQLDLIQEAQTPEELMLHLLGGAWLHWNMRTGDEEDLDSEPATVSDFNQLLQKKEMVCRSDFIWDEALWGFAFALLQIKTSHSHDLYWEILAGFLQGDTPSGRELIEFMKGKIQGLNAAAALKPSRSLGEYFRGLASWAFALARCGA